MTISKGLVNRIGGRVRVRGAYDYFLGHAPVRIADRHYAKAPQEMLDQGIVWLGQEYRNAGCFQIPASS
jgi:hypothetical protein